MIKKFIEQQEKSIIKKFKTSSPYEIADSISNLTYYQHTLPPNLNGLYIYKSAHKQILCINDKLDYSMVTFTLCHELGHHFLEHRSGLMVDADFLSCSQVETDANIFAGYLFADFLDIHSKQECSDLIIPINIFNVLDRILPETIESNQS